MPLAPAASSAESRCQVPVGVAGNQQLYESQRRVPRVPDRVPLAARLQHVRPRFGDHHVVAEPRSEPSFEHDRELVLARVAVQRGREVTRRQRVLDDRDATLGDESRHLVNRAERSERGVKPLARTDDCREREKNHGVLWFNLDLST